MSQCAAEIKGFPLPPATAPPPPLGLPCLPVSTINSPGGGTLARNRFYLLALFLEFLCDMYVRVRCKKMGWNMKGKKRDRTKCYWAHWDAFPFNETPRLLGKTWGESSTYSDQVPRAEEPVDLCGFCKNRSRKTSSRSRQILITHTHVHFSSTLTAG